MRLHNLSLCLLGLLVATVDGVASGTGFEARPAATGTDGQVARTEAAVTDTLLTAENCLQCHAPGSDLARYGIEMERIYAPTVGRDYRIDPGLFSESNHARLACRICHVVGKEVYPHVEEAKEQYFDCSHCHDRTDGTQKYDVEKIEAEFKKSVHYEEMGDRFSCFSCHDPHVFDLTDETKTITRIVRDDNAVCLRCHDSAPDFESLTEREYPIIEQTHSWLPNTKLHWDAVRCVECHTAHTETFTHEILPGDRAEKLCVSCHRTDSILLTTLYKYRSREERSRVGFVNAAIFGESYVIGVTRNEVLDRWSVIILVAMIAGIAAHGVLRVVTARWRARP